MSKPTFPLNAWYAAAYDVELKRALLPRTICNKPVVLYRKNDGTPVALADACWHRLVPLSLGRLEGDNVVCGYHGLEFDDTGRCVYMPSQDTINPSACVKSYPIAEKHRFIAAGHVGQIGDVDDGLIHRHAPQHWAALAADQHRCPIARRAWNSIRVAGAKDGNGRVAGEGSRAAVADGRAARQGLYQADASAKTEHRFRVHLGQQRIGVGQDPELQQPDAHRVEEAGVRRHGLQSGAVVRVDEERAEVDAGAGLQRGEEAPALLGGERGVVVGTGKMREDAGEPQVRGGADL